MNDAHLHRIDGSANKYCSAYAAGYHKHKQYEVLSNQSIRVVVVEAHFSTKFIVVDTIYFSTKTAEKAELY